MILKVYRVKKPKLSVSLMCSLLLTGKLNGVLSKTTTEMLAESKCKGITSDFKDESMLCVNIYRSKDSLRVSKRSTQLLLVVQLT